MPLAKIEIPPGLKRESTEYTNIPKWVDADKARFWKGRPEKLGGWQKCSNNTFEGKARGSLLPFTTLNNDRYIGIGTHKRLYIESGGAYHDITPVDDSGSLGTDPFTTTNGSSNITVNHSSHGRKAGDIVSFSGASAFNGVTVDGEYEVDSVTDANNYVVVDDETASASGAGGGVSVTYSYLLPVGRQYSLRGLGYGAGPYDEEFYGDARSVSGFILAARTWSLASWGEDLIANPRGGNIYTWDSSAGLSGNAATAISNAPAANFILVSQINRHLIALGCEESAGSGTIDPLLIRWSDQEDNTVWTPSETVTAGDIRLSVDAKEIVGGLESKREILVWTDNTLHAMRPLFNNFVFGVENLGTNCGLIAAHATIDYNGIAFWMGHDDFYMYDGAVRPLYCDIQEDVFEDLNLLQRRSIFAAVNRKFNEIWWFYVSKDQGGNEIGRYVIYNPVEDTWVWGTLVRTSWADPEIFDHPIAAGDDNILYEHEMGADGDGESISSFIESGEFELPIEGPGEHMVFVDRIIPDFDISGNLTMKIHTRRYPNASETTKGPFTISSSTEKVDLRARGRQFAIRIDNDELGSDWRLGTIRANLEEDGLR